MSYQITTQNREIGENADAAGYGICGREIPKEDRKVRMQVPAMKMTGPCDVVTSTGKAVIRSAFFQNDKGKTVRSIETDKRCTFCMIVTFLEDITAPLFGFELETNKGDRVYGVNNFMLQDNLKRAEGGKTYFISFSLMLPRLHSGHYLITPAVASGVQSRHVVHHRLHNFDTIIIENQGFDSALIELDADFTIHECDPSKIRFV